MLRVGYMKERLKMKDKKLYYLDTVNFGIRSQKEDDLFNLNSSVLSDETLRKVLDDINKNLNKTNKELM
jgi:outer membrane protein OmpA-like peptidoglycan-associated protein